MKSIPVTGNFKADWFCRILDEVTLRVKPIWIIGDPANQRPDYWSYILFIPTDIPVFPSALPLSCGMFCVYKILSSVCAHSVNPKQFVGGTPWRGWLRHCAISRKVAGSVLYGVTEIFD
jgi:hypothetical protein